MGNKESKNENTNTEKINFFSDQPIAADKEQDIRFGHLDIADNLKKIILNCPSPFTIGLFGKWGSGKTTILNAIRKKLQDNNKDNIAVVSFDVWKYEGDSLRRTFLRQLENQLKNEKYIPKGYKIKEKSETGSQKEITNKLTWNWFNTICLIPLIVVAIILWLNPEAYKSAFTNGALFLAIIIILIDKIITKEKVIISSERLQDPYEFEEEFIRITKEISSKNLLVIIDNLDRCIHDKAVELLSTIKTFLAKDVDVDENNKCIFLIACDDEAIKAHLKNVFIMNQTDGNIEDSFSADEFLRKFFNVSLRIPDFIDTELQTYTEDLLKEINISQFKAPNISYVITTAFRENPRQIKQFINILIAVFFLAKNREESKNPLIIPKGVITENVAFLAKFLIIQQKYPKEYKTIKESYLDIDEIENIGKADYRAFLEATKTISVSEIRPFIYLKQSEEELIIPGVKELELCLIDNKHEIVKEKINKLKVNPDYIKNLNRFILSLIEKNRIKNRIPSLFNIISSSLEALRHNKLELEQRYYDKISYLLSDGRYLRDELEKFQISLIFDELLVRCNARDRKEIIDQYLNILGQSKGDTKEPRISINEASIIFKLLQEHKKWLGQKQKENMKQKLNEIYYSFPEVLSIFSEDEQRKREFITEDTISKFVSTFSDADVESQQNINEKVKLLLKFKEIIIPKIAKEVITSFQNLLKNENQKPYRKEKENLLKCIENIFDVLYDYISNITDKTVLNSFADTITQGINKIGKWDQKKIFIFVCLKLVNMLEEPSHLNINTLIQNFFTNADIDSIKFIFNKFKSSEEKKRELIIKYSGIFQQKALEQQPIFDFLYPLATRDIRIQWMTNLIISQLQRALEKLKELSYRVDDKKVVIETLLQTAKNVAFQEKNNIYQTVNQMKCANSKELRNVFASQIKPLLKSEDKNQQKVGYIAFQEAAYFSETLKRNIAREVVERLRSLQPSDAGQIYTVKSVLISWDILESPVKKDYIDFVFDKLIKRGINIDNIRLGFEIFYEVKPKYEEYSTYFDDVFARLEESEGNDQIKTEIKSGLLKLKPPKIKTNKEGMYWGEIEKYKIAKDIQ